MNIIANTTAYGSKPVTACFTGDIIKRRHVEAVLQRNKEYFQELIENAF